MFSFLTSLECEVLDPEVELSKTIIQDSVCFCDHTPSQISHVAIVVKSCVLEVHLVQEHHVVVVFTGLKVDIGGHVIGQPTNTLGVPLVEETEQPHVGGTREVALQLAPRNHLLAGTNREFLEHPEFSVHVPSVSR